jgi:hypothetical protein
MKPKKQTSIWSKIIEKLPYAPLKYIDESVEKQTVTTPATLGCRHSRRSSICGFRLIGADIVKCWQ